jgi:hypothetical protein
VADNGNGSRYHAHQHECECGARLITPTDHPLGTCQDCGAAGVPVSLYVCPAGDHVTVRCDRCVSDDHNAECRCKPVTAAVTRGCEWCGDPIESPRPEARYCSTRCRVAAYRDRGASVAPPGEG